MKSSFKQLLTMFISFFVAQALIVYLAFMFFSSFVVLGNHFYSPIQSLLQSVFVMSLIAVGITPVMELLSERYQIKLQTKHWLVLYFVLNTVTVWFVARSAEMLGFGISSWMVAVALGLIFDIEQGLIARQLLGKAK
jgi:hypothetical protein